MLAQNKLLCLSEIPDSMLMWAHYAENHQGVVIRFRSAPGIDSPWAEGRPVEYVPNMPLLFDADFLADMMSGRVAMNVPVLINRLVFTKSTDWAHEREWRIWSGVGRNPNAPYEDIPFNAQELDTVIFGCRITQGDRATISAMVRRLYPHAGLLQAVRREREFGLDVLPLEI